MIRAPLSDLGQWGFLDHPVPDIAAFTVPSWHFKIRFHIATSASLITSIVTTYTKAVTFHIIVQLPNPS